MTQQDNSAQSGVYMIQQLTAPAVFDKTRQGEKLLRDNYNHYYVTVIKV